MVGFMRPLFWFLACSVTILIPARMLMKSGHCFEQGLDIVPVCQESRDMQSIRQSQHNQTPSPTPLLCYNRLRSKRIFWRRREHLSHLLELFSKSEIALLYQGSNFVHSGPQLENVAWL